MDVGEDKDLELLAIGIHVWPLHRRLVLEDPVPVLDVRIEEQRRIVAHLHLHARHLRVKEAFDDILEEGLDEIDFSGVAEGFREEQSADHLYHISNCVVNYA